MNMLALGYMAKRVARRPDWLAVPSVDDIYSISDCVSENFCDYISFWRHNGYWLFDSPSVIQEIAGEEQIDLLGTVIFYYEAFPLEFDADQNVWREFVPEPSFSTNVVPPKSRKLEGYDVATFSVGNAPECSPLSCSHLASEIAVNKHCLIDSFENTKNDVGNGKFNNSEPGPYRIIAVYTTEELPEQSVGHEGADSAVSSG